ncbi:MAG: hypothetical protein OXH19_05650 [Chloroflexi bacterium]|nr:hypothetical protein [Chloroflexota bacterium]MCY3589940.1 hypothetical protein [Chloroflexota bacterium]MCY3684619.1 hypothetical protein [Chloroflexota bacterium]MDE2709985.1 hypothetical protein [Chloroflexota bacterium]
MVSAGQPPDKQTIEGMREHVIDYALPNLIAKTRDHLDGGPYGRYEVLNEIDLIEADLERLRATEEESSG